MARRVLAGLAVLLFAFGVNAQENASSANAWNTDPHAPQVAPSSTGNPSPQLNPPGAYPPGYPGQAWQPLAYESQKRSPGIALLLEFFIPGVGSIYGDHLTGALINWGLEIMGVVLMFDSLNIRTRCEYNSYDYRTDCGSDINDGEFVVGLGLLLGGRIYGFIDAYTSTHEYNRRLRRQLGLPDWISMGLAPIRSGQNEVAYAPTLRLRF